MLREVMNKWAVSPKRYEVAFVLHLKGILEGWTGSLKIALSLQIC